MEDANGMNIIGFLSPKGEIIKCCSWGHSSKAEEICKKAYEKEFAFGLAAEDYLLSLGYLVLRARDAYMSNRNEDGEWILLKVEQLNWLEENSSKLNAQQKKDVSDILLDQELLRHRAKEKTECKKSN